MAVCGNAERPFPVCLGNKKFVLEVLLCKKGQQLFLLTLAHFVTVLGAGIGAVMTFLNELTHGVESNLADIGVLLHKLGIVVIVTEQVVEVNHGAVTVRPAACA